MFCRAGAGWICRGGIRVTLRGRETLQVHPHPVAVKDTQSWGHIPIPGKRNFPIDLPS